MKVTVCPLRHIPAVYSHVLSLAKIFLLLISNVVMSRVMYLYCCLILVTNKRWWNN